jgi:hypothetical protein
MIYLLLSTHILLISKVIFLDKKQKSLLINCLEEFKASDGFIITNSNGIKWKLNHETIIKKLEKVLE